MLDSSSWHKTCLTIGQNPTKRLPMSMMKELASVNLFVIFLVIMGGFAFLRIVKRRLED